jgi:tetratricopeptide (TPR) repeat protein
MKLLQGIQLHELILMILGFILGLVLIFIFLYTALKSKPNLKLLYGFIAPLVMIGYPSIQSVQFSNEVVKIDKIVEEVKKDPTNVEAQKELIDHLEKLPASRCKNSSDAMATIANAQASLGLYDSAKVTIQTAVELRPSSNKALESQKEITEKWEAKENMVKQIGVIENMLKTMETQPQNTLLKDSLNANLSNLKPDKVLLDNKHLVILARAIAVAGQKEQAIQLTDKVLRVSPDNKEAEKLQNDINSKKIDRAYGNSRTRPAPPKANNTTVKPQASTNRVRPVPAPAPVYMDTNLIRLYPKTSLSFKKWNAKG